MQPLWPCYNTVPSASSSILTSVTTGFAYAPDLCRLIRIHMQAVEAGRFLYFSCPILQVNISLSPSKPVVNPRTYPSAALQGRYP